MTSYLYQFEYHLLPKWATWFYMIAIYHLVGCSALTTPTCHLPRLPEMCFGSPTTGRLPFVSIILHQVILGRPICRPFWENGTYSLPFSPPNDMATKAWSLWVAMGVTLHVLILYSITERTLARNSPSLILVLR